jgi:mannose-6-phosphate isomerase class I
LLELLRPDSAEALQAALKPWLATRHAPPADLSSALRPLLVNGEDWPEAEALLAALRATYWSVLDALNAVPVKAGDVIYNANPERITAASGQPASAEVHALGNPEGRGVFALEIRFPGTTFRAWDNVRFPLREIDIDAALEALNLTATRTEEFIVERKAVRAGVRRSIDSEYFRLDHLEPAPSFTIDVPASTPHSLHTLAGRVRLMREDGEVFATLERGESAIVPAHVGAYRIAADNEPAELVKVMLPPYAD